MTISDSTLILGRIVQVLVQNEYAQVTGYYRFDLVKLNARAIDLKRRKGTTAKISLKKILQAIDFYKYNLAAYDRGPAELRKFGLKYITSPVFALLHLVPKDVYHQ